MRLGQLHPLVDEIIVQRNADYQGHEEGRDGHIGLRKKEALAKVDQVGDHREQQRQ